MVKNFETNFLFVYIHFMDPDLDPDPKLPSYRTELDLAESFGYLQIRIHITE
jgi:hypothetical protein